MSWIARRKSLSRKRILIADDTESGRELLRYILGGCGHMVATAANGQQVLDTVAGFCPDLIILDLHMRRMDGWTAAIALRKYSGMWQPIVAMAAVATQSAPAEIYEAGSSAYLIKPIAPELLRQCVAHLLEVSYPPPSFSQIN